MVKDTFYFSHDYNARNDDKMIAVRMKYGAEGYGIYFMILERLREDKQYTSIRDYNIIAFDLRVASEKVKAIVEDFDLFAFTNDGKFYSPSLVNHIRKKDRYKSVKTDRVRMYNSNVKKWYRLIKEVFKRDDYTCQYCGSVGWKLEADHIIPFSKGGEDTLDNLTTACRTCNRQKRNKSVEEFNNWRNGQKK